MDHHLQIDPAKKHRIKKIRIAKAAPGDLG
jgi:hypothetical protein